ncbi:MAG: hypothetical protein U0768_20350 [Anaerolineae bacterium]
MFSTLLATAAPPRPSLLFPKLALSLSGFETGVAVMPLVKGRDADTEDKPGGRIRNTCRLLIMSVFMLSGEGDVPRVTREVLRQAIEDPSRRPAIHVAG